MSMDASAWAAWYAAAVATAVLAKDIYKDSGVSWWPAIKAKLSTTMPLKDAAQKFYQQARVSHSYWSSAADKLAVEDSPTARLDYCSHALKHADIKWFGVHPPSKIMEELSPIVVNNCSFLTSELDILGTDGRTYVNVRVSKRGLRSILKKVRDGAPDI